MSGTKYTKTKLYEDLADSLSLSDEKIKHWIHRFHYNSRR